MFEYQATAQELALLTLETVNKLTGQQSELVAGLDLSNGISLPSDLRLELSVSEEVSVKQSVECWKVQDLEADVVCMVEQREGRQTLKVFFKEKNKLQGQPIFRINGITNPSSTQPSSNFAAKFFTGSGDLIAFQEAKL